jgi:hypothetical protein
MVLDRLCFARQAIDGGFKVVDGSENTGYQAPAHEFGEKTSTALSQDAEVGVKWKVQNTDLPPRSVRATEMCRNAPGAHRLTHCKRLGSVIAAG